MKDYDKKQRTVISSILRCEQFIWFDNVAKLPANNFKWIEYTSQFNGDFIRNYNEESDKDYFL